MSNCLDAHLGQIVYDKDGVVDWCIVLLEMPLTRFQECWPLPKESLAELPQKINTVTLTLIVWPIKSDVSTSLLLPHLSSPLTDSLPSLNLLCYSKTDAWFMQDGRKAVWSIPYVSVASFFPSWKQNSIAYRSFKMSSRPDCIFEIHQLWQSCFSRVYSNCCCSCSFEPEIIKIGQSSHKMYCHKILNFQESTTILNSCTKKSGILLKAQRIYIYIYIYIEREREREKEWERLLYICYKIPLWLRQNAKKSWWIELYFQFTMFRSRTTFMFLSILQQLKPMPSGWGFIQISTW